MREERGKPRSTIWLVWSRVERVAGRAAGNLFPLLTVLVFGAIVIGVLFVLAVLALAIAGAL
jgi:multisubunit Na+/H+ antiporter MnhC subunit